MKIALSVKGVGLGAWLDDFMDCGHVMIVEDNNQFQSWANDFEGTGDNASDQLCESIIQKAPDILITGRIDQESQQKMEDENIRVFSKESGFVLDLVEKFRDVGHH